VVGGVLLSFFFAEKRPLSWDDLTCFYRKASSPEYGDFATLLSRGISSAMIYYFSISPQNRIMTLGKKVTVSELNEY